MTDILGNKTEQERRDEFLKEARLRFRDDVLLQQIFVNMALKLSKQDGDRHNLFYGRVEFKVKDLYKDIVNEIDRYASNLYLVKEEKGKLLQESLSILVEQDSLISEDAVNAAVKKLGYKTPNFLCSSQQRHKDFLKAKKDFIQLLDKEIERINKDVGPFYQRRFFSLFISKQKTHEKLTMLAWARGTAQKLTELEELNKFIHSLLKQKKITQTRNKFRVADQGSTTEKNLETFNNRYRRG